MQEQQAAAAAAAAAASSQQDIGLARLGALGALADIGNDGNDLLESSTINYEDLMNASSSFQQQQQQHVVQQQPKQKNFFNRASELLDLSSGDSRGTTPQHETDWSQQVGQGHSSLLLTDANCVEPYIFQF